jgi:hypothetical protein
LCKQISLVITTYHSRHIATNTSLLVSILDPTVADDIRGFGFRTVRRIHDLRNPLIASTLPQQDASGGGMGEDMSTNRLPAVSTSK